MPVMISSTIKPFSRFTTSWRAFRFHHLDRLIPRRAQVVQSCAHDAAEG
jgi:hypothetical protein